MTYYEAQFDGATDTYDIAFGSRTLHLELTWDDSIQAEYDEYVNALKTQASNEPMHNGKRDYDFLAYYDSIPHDDLQAWFLEHIRYHPDPTLPDIYYRLAVPSAYGSLDVSKCVIALQEHFDMCTWFRAQMDSYVDSLVWHISLTNETETIQADVRYNGIVTFSDSTAVQFTLANDLQQAGVDDMAQIRVIIGDPV